MTRTESRTYETKVGELVTAQVLIIPAVVKSIPSATRTNSNGTQWRLAHAEIMYPNGTRKAVPAQLFEKSYEMFPDNFVPGMDVELEVQLEGEGKGMAKMQLPSLEKIDVSAFLQDAGAELTDNLVDDELVS